MTDKLSVRTISISRYSRIDDTVAVAITHDRIMMYMSADEARQLAIDLVNAAEQWEKAINAQTQGTLPLAHTA